MTHDYWVLAVAFSPDGQWVVSGSSDKTVRVWEAASGREVARMTHDDRVNAVAFSPDGKWVVSASKDKTARVWEAASGQEVARMTHDGAVNAVAFSPGPACASPPEANAGRCGQWVVSGSSDGTARVWEASSGREVSRTTHDNDIVFAVAFSPGPACASPPEANAERCGRWVVTGSWHGVVRVWEAASGREVARMRHDDKVTAVAFSPGPACASPPEANAERCGQWVVSASWDDTARVRLWQPEDMIAAVCARLPRNFTRAEWRQYLEDVPYRATCPNLPEAEAKE